jgi:hypothetical protein
MHTSVQSSLKQIHNDSINLSSSVGSSTVIT